jgi:hypothetical protein
MAFPSGTTISTSNLDSASDDPSQARANLLTAVQTLNQLIASENGANGVAVLDGNGQLDGSHLPITIDPTSLILAPQDGIVKVEDRVRLQIKTAAQVLAWDDPAVGDMCLIATDLTGASPKLAMYDGTNWKYVALSSWTTVT